MIDGLLDACLENFSYEQLDVSLSEIKRAGYSARQVLSQAVEEFISNPQLPDVHKLQIGHQAALVEKNLLDGASEELQLRSFFSYVLSLCYKG